MNPFTTSLLDILRHAMPYGLTRAWESDYNNAYDMLKQSGVSTESPRHYFGGSRNSDAHRLASLLANDPHYSEATQARYVALLKQLGYLQHQAY